MRTQKRGRNIFACAAIALAAGWICALAAAAETTDLQGWGADDPYNRHYNSAMVEKLNAWVVGFKFEAPLPGMSPATIMMVHHGSELIDVHMCPSWFAKPEDIGLRIGDRVKIRGCRAPIGGREVFMAAKVKRGDFFEFKVRLTREGKPFWTFTPEELVAEIERQQAAGPQAPEK